MIDRSLATIKANRAKKHYSGFLLAECNKPAAVHDGRRTHATHKSAGTEKKKKKKKQWPADDSKKHFGKSAQDVFYYSR
jgi:hypothetical protein